jgi:hypothetical protein
MTPDISDALITGNGRLTRVFATMFLALRRKPLALLAAGMMSFMPMLIYILRPFNAYIQDMLYRWPVQGVPSHFPPPITFIIFALVSFCFAWSTGPLCWLTYKAIYPDKKNGSFLGSFRALLPMMLLWMLIFLLSTLAFMVADILPRFMTGDTEYVLLIWLGLMLAGLASLPAFLCLFAPVVTLEKGTLKQKWSRMMALGKGFRWLIIGYALACGLAGFIAAFALATGLVAILPMEIRYTMDDWIYLANLGVFWMAMCMIATVLYARIRLARGELDPEDVATVFE